MAPARARITAFAVLLVLGCFSAPAVGAEANKPGTGADRLRRAVDDEQFYARAKERSALMKKRTARAADVAKWLAEGSAVLLDLRAKEKFEKSRLKGARNLPASELTDEAAAAVVPSKATRVVIYCDYNLAPVRMIAATTLGFPALMELGYGDVWRLEELWNAPACGVKKGEVPALGRGCPPHLPLEAAAAAAPAAATPAAATPAAATPAAATPAPAGR